MLGKAIQWFKLLRSTQRVNLALARGAAASALRQLDPTDPATWEFCGFSQNGEDGVIDYLSRRVKAPNRYFIEIGGSDAIENNTSWLAIARKYSGMMVEGDRETALRAEELISFLNLPLVRCVNMFAARDSAAEIKKLAVHADPDVLSLDIDGNDYHVASALLDAGLRPKIWVAEYNAAYGPSRSLTIAYREDFRVQAADSELYFGVSLAGWKRFFAGRGYRFIGVDANGVNAFFVDPAAFEPGFLAGLKVREFQENPYQLLRFRAPWNDRFALIADRPFVEIP
jgi:hypothetical protein